MDCQFQPTVHARRRLAERGISRREALEVMIRGARFRQGAKLVSRHRRLSVVWKKRPCHYYVITVMQEGST